MTTPRPLGLLLVSCALVMSSVVCVVGFDQFDELDELGTAVAEASARARKASATAASRTPTSPTATPSPTPTPSPSPTPTPTPTPTLTPTHDPAIVAPPDPLIVLTDPPGDTIKCASEQAVDDPAADIQAVSVYPAGTSYFSEFAGQHPGLIISIRLGAHAVSVFDNDFSFAVVLFYQKPDQTYSGYMLEIHDQVERIGEIDTEFNLVRRDPLVSRIDPLTGEVNFKLPEDALGFAVRAYHLADEAGLANGSNCDQAPDTGGYRNPLAP